MQTVYRQFLKFVLVGTSNTLIDFAIYTALTRLSVFWFNHKIGAAAIGFLIATVNSYIWNKYWTFKNKSDQHHIQSIKFFIVGVAGLGFNVVIFWLLLPLGWYDLFVKGIAIVIILFWNFTINRIWTFAER